MSWAGGLPPITVKPAAPLTHQWNVCRLGEGRLTGLHPFTFRNLSSISTTQPDDLTTVWYLGWVQAGSHQLNLRLVSPPGSWFLDPGSAIFCYNPTLPAGKGWIHHEYIISPWLVLVHTHTHTRPEPYKLSASGLLVKRGAGSVWHQHLWEKTCHRVKESWVTMYMLSSQRKPQHQNMHKLHPRGWWVKIGWMGVGELWLLLLSLWCSSFPEGRFHWLGQNLKNYTNCQKRKGILTWCAKCAYFRYQQVLCTIYNVYVEKNKRYIIR